MFLEKGSVSLAAYLNISDVKRKKKTTVEIKSGNIRHFILLAQLILLMFAGPAFSVEISNCQSDISASNCSTRILENLRTNCERAPNGEVNISLSSPWVKSPAATCSDLLWMDVLLSRIHNVSNSSFTLECRELENVTNILKEISATFSKFSSAVESFDCEQRFSTRTNCSQCLKSYKRWLCMVQFYTKEIKPCLDVCYDVYRSCPSFEPDESYGGYHIFECPKEGDEYSSYGPTSNCMSVASLLRDKG